MYHKLLSNFPQPDTEHLFVIVMFNDLQAETHPFSFMFIYHSNISCSKSIKAVSHVSGPLNMSRIVFYHPVKCVDAYFLS